MHNKEVLYSMAIYISAYITYVLMLYIGTGSQRKTMTQNIFQINEPFAYRLAFCSFTKEGKKS